MTTFLITSVFSALLLLILGAPLFVVAWQRGDAETAQRFLVAAGLMALLIAILSASSARLVAQCEAAGNPGCVDSGSSGLRFLFIGGYAFTSWLNAYFIARD